jgi:hypothetical protein
MRHEVDLLYSKRAASTKHCTVAKVGSAALVRVNYMRSSIDCAGRERFANACRAWRAMIFTLAGTCAQSANAYFLPLPTKCHAWQA